MELAAVRAIAELAQAETAEQVALAYNIESISFGPEYLIPRPFDPRLIARVAPAVAKAAMDSGVATRPIIDFDAYDERLNRFIFRSGTIMKPLFARAKMVRKRVIYAEGEDERILRAAQVSIEEGLAAPILIGRPDVVAQRLERHGLSIRPGQDFELINPEDDPRYRDYVQTYLELTCRKGITPDAARTIVRTRSTVIAAIALRRGEADAMICGLEGRFDTHLRHVREVIGLAPGVRDFSTLSLVILSSGPYFIVDTYVSYDPSVEEVAEMTLLTAAQVRRFGLEPKIALLSHSNFGSRDSASASKMRRALEVLREADPDLEVEGEMHGDYALNEELRERVFPLSRLKGEANVLVMPNLDAANISYQLIKGLADALPVGPILLGAARPAHILTPSVTARGVVNMTAVAAVEAQQKVVELPQFSSRRRA
jgi:malate dehydrogenase (oxaloacetate-decarboxylating)(NADP+)